MISVRAWIVAAVRIVLVRIASAAARKMKMWSKLAFIIPLLFFLPSCFPPNVVDPEDTEPVIPDPVEVTELFDGIWVGSVTFFSTDGFGNTETLNTGFSTVVSQSEVGTIIGTATFETALTEECSLSGAQQEALVNFILICEGITGFTFEGELDEGRLSGEYLVTSTEILFRNGVFVLAFAGGN